MKKILNILGTITLIATSTTSLVACNTPQEYTQAQIDKLKEENNIKTNDGVLEWIAPQEKPFNKTDNKWYYVVWRGDKNDNWRIIKYKYEKQGLLEDYNNFIISINNKKELYIFKKQGAIGFSTKWNKNNDYFKSVYRWNSLDKPDPDLVLDENGNVKVK